MSSSQEKTTVLDMRELSATAELPPLAVPHPADSQARHPARKVSPRQVVASVALIAATTVFVRTAWMSDDAYISLRVVDNFVNGYGLRWNILERVQAMTNPLWTLLLAIPYFFTREAFFTTLAVSWICLLATMGLGLRLAYNASAAWVVGAALLLSRAFVEYSSSGLENPLSYLLLAIFLTRFLAAEKRPRDLLVQTLCFSLLLVNRMDNLWYTLPAMALTMWPERKNRRAWIDVALGLTPFVAWELFSIFYYGFPFPNTYYAKLTTGIPSREYWAQGARYLLHFAATDPSSFCVIVATLVLGTISRSRKKAVLAAGILLHVIYVMRVGGDFMNGRFFASSVLVATIFVGHSSIWRTRRLAPIVIAVLATLSLSLPTSPLRTTDQYSGSHINDAGIADERGWYYTNYHLGLASLSKRIPQASREIREARTARLHGIGMAGFGAGPSLHGLDQWALSDPLMARIPAAYEPNWRIGHFRREFPGGYDSAALTGENSLYDTKLGTYWEKLVLITRGPLFSFDRWATIVAMNLGQYDHLVDRVAYRYPGREIPGALLTVHVADGVAATDGRVESMTFQGLRVKTGPKSGRSIDVSLARDAKYAVVFLNGGQELDTVFIEPKDGSGMYANYFEIPPRAQGGFDTLYFKPLSGDGPYAVGHLNIQN